LGLLNIRCIAQQCLTILAGLHSELRNGIVDMSVCPYVRRTFKICQNIRTSLYGIRFKHIKR